MRTDVGTQIKNVCTLGWDEIWKKQNQNVGEIKRTIDEWTTNGPNRKNQ